MKRLTSIAVLSITLSGTASAGDWVATFLDSVGRAYPGVKYLDYSDGSRWELAECEKFGAYLAGRFGIDSMEKVRTATFVGPITQPQFWTATNKIKNKAADFSFGSGKVTYTFKGQPNRQAFPFQEIEDSRNFKGTRFFTGLANVEYKPVVCAVAVYGK